MTVSKTVEKLESAKWEKPVIGEIDMGMSDIRFGFNPGTDGDTGGSTTSMS